MSKSVLLLLDGNSLINRAFYGLFGRQQMTAPDGTPTGALFAFLNMFLRYLAQIDATHIVVAFDRKEPTMRHTLYDGYKATRKPMPDELAIQLPILKDILDGMGIRCIEKAGYEADDLLGTMAEIGKQQTADVYIVSGDKDSFQLVDDKVTIIWPVTRQGQSELEIYDRQAIIDRYELQPEQFVDFKAIMGDPSDNIPGVKGIGEKGALELLKQYPSLDALYDSLDELKPAQMKKLEASREMAFLSRELATICRQVPIDENMDDFKRREMDPGQLSDLLSRLGLKQLMSRLNLESHDKNKQEDATDEVSIEPLTPPMLGERLGKLKTEIIACWLTHHHQMLLMADSDQIWLIDPAQIKDAWQVISDSKVRTAVCDYKQILHTFQLSPLSLPAHDILLAAHLLNQIDGRPDLARLYQAITGQTLILEDASPAVTPYQEQELFSDPGQPASGQGKKKTQADGKDVPAAADADGSQDKKTAQADGADAEDVPAADLKQLRAVYEIAGQQVKAIHERQIEPLAYEIEMPLAAILAEMERRGFVVDKERKPKKATSLRDLKIVQQMDSTQ